MKDQKEIFNEYKKSLEKYDERKLKENKQLIGSFIDYSKELGIVLKKSNFTYNQRIGIIAEYPNILNMLNKAIVVDKEGLVNFSLLKNHFEIKRLVSGYLFADNYMPMAHHYFRRGYDKGTNFFPNFINMYWGYPESNQDKFVALDFDRVRINVNNAIYLEADTWYGAKFSREIEMIGDGVTKLRPPLDLKTSYVDLFFNEVYALDVKWYTKDRIKVFQLEELKNENVQLEENGKKYFPARYLHAEYDLDLKRFRHFDGAIHLYNKKEYLKRRDSDLNYNSKEGYQIKAQSKKLFKLNGPVSTQSWVELTSQFLTGNPLIFEYFEGRLPQRIEDVVAKLRNS